MRAIGVFIFLLAAQMASATEQVIVGDSHSCGTFGTLLARELFKSGEPVTLYCTPSSAPLHWMKGRNPKGFSCSTLKSPEFRLSHCEKSGELSIADILTKHKAAKYFVALGTNSLLNGVTDSSYAALAKAIGTAGGTCAWIGPPHVDPARSKGFPKGWVEKVENNLNAFYTSLDRAIGDRCWPIDSRPATAAGTPGFRTSDGIHRNDEGAKGWVEQIKARLQPPPSN
ncbi:MAG: SGNH/GDSL hydrolase family protein [Bdellovibrionia bacterium]